MRPVNFDQVNNTLKKPADMTDAECGPLPVFTDGETCISLWKMTWKERISAIIFGKVWLFVTSGYTQPPVALMVQREIFSKGSKADTKAEGDHYDFEATPGSQVVINNEKILSNPE